MFTNVIINRCLAVFTTAALIAGVASHASAAIASPTAQKRVLATHAEASSDIAAPIADTDSDASASFDPYAGDIESQAAVGPPPLADAHGQAMQTSFFLPNQIHCDGTTEASILTQFVHLGELTRQSYADATADSTCEFIFTVDESMDWQLSGLLTSNFAGSIASVLLKIDGGATLFSALADFDNNLELVPFDVTQTLLPGNLYKLTFSSSSVATGVGGEEVDEFIINTGGSYNGQISVVPEPTTLALLALFLPFHARRRR